MQAVNALLQNFEEGLYCNKILTIAVVFMTSVLTLLRDTWFSLLVQEKCQQPLQDCHYHSARKDWRDPEDGILVQPSAPTDS